MDIDSAIMPQPTLLERLRKDHGGDGWADVAIDSRKAVKEAVDALRQDLRLLLNTRRSFAGLPDRFSGLEDSVIGYGLPDAMHIGLKSPEQRARFRRELEAAIRAFEPRLSDLRLEEVERGPSPGQRIGFRLSALFEMDGQPVPVVFDTTLNDARDRMAVDAADGSV